MCSLTCFGGKVGVSLPFCHMTLNPWEWCETSEGTALFFWEGATNLWANPPGKTCEGRFGPASSKKQLYAGGSASCWRSARKLWVCQLRGRREENSRESNRLHGVAKQTWKGGKVTVITGTGVSDWWKQRSDKERQSDGEILSNVLNKLKKTTLRMCPNG